MKHVLETTENLSVKQAEIVKIHTQNHAVCAVETEPEQNTPAVLPLFVRVLFLAADYHWRPQPMRDNGWDVCGNPAYRSCLRELGLNLMRFKTGYTAQ